ncbi:DUF5997 family protein [Corynebacterium sp. UBA2622]|uniref:DUF5997 family protein n=1 Tax=Corynebacterium sp. UBA2622 TaxID=1946393 RepID=UPI0025C23802|nr:DUF5997 family protein [Corynebacterium sp. UBA2622]
MTNQQPSGTAMKPATAAKKLGIHLPATPQNFQEGAVTHGELRDLQANPPEWLQELRLNGPHPRPEVARKLGISITALKKNGMDEPLTTEQIKNLLADQPEWLREARTALAEERDAGDSGEGSGKDGES